MEMIQRHLEMQITHTQKNPKHAALKSKTLTASHLTSL